MKTTAQTNALQILLPKTLRVESGVDRSVAIRWIDQHLPDPSDQREYARERCRIVLTEAIGEAIEEAGLTRTEIAEKLGVTKGYVSQVLGGSRNMTLKTLGDLLWACDLEVQDMVTRPLGVVLTTSEGADEWGSSLWKEWGVGLGDDALISSPPMAAYVGTPADSAANDNLALAA